MGLIMTEIIISFFFANASCTFLHYLNRLRMRWCFFQKSIELTKYAPPKIPNPGVQWE